MSKLGILRAIRDDEVMMMLEWRNHPDIRGNMYNRHTIDASEHLRWWDALRKDPGKRYFIYEYDGVASGVVGFTGIDTANRRADWAFYAAPGARTGTGSRMEFLALDFAFATLQLNKLCCEVLAFNKAVIKLHQRFGFSVEGILRQHHLKDGQYEDIYVMGLLAGEWSERAPPMLSKLTGALRASDKADQS